MPLNENFLLCAYTDTSANLGALKFKVRLRLCQAVLSLCLLARPRAYSVVDTDFSRLSTPLAVQLEAARRDLAEPLARVGVLSAGSDAAPASGT
jgi:hypothetical protein